MKDFGYVGKKLTMFPWILDKNKKSVTTIK
jgi:hypothetical protein